MVEEMRSNKARYLQEAFGSFSLTQAEVKRIHTAVMSYLVGRMKHGIHPWLIVIKITLL